MRNLFKANTWPASIISFWCPCYLGTDFTYCCGVSIADFEQANSGWYTNESWSKTMWHNIFHQINRIDGKFWVIFGLIIRLLQIDFSKIQVTTLELRLNVPWFHKFSWVFFRTSSRRNVFRSCNFFYNMVCCLYLLFIFAKMLRYRFLVGSWIQHCL